MSLELAESWVLAKFRPLQSATDARKLFQETAADGVEATLIVAPELTNNGKGYLARWTGQELVVLELSPRQQRQFGVVAGSLFRELEGHHEPPELPAARRVTISDVQIDGALPHDGWTPLTGKCTFEMDDPSGAAISGCALRVHYFRPDLPRQITGYWHTDTPLVPPRGTLRFSFVPIFSPNNPVRLQGPLVLFIQLMTARDWTHLSLCQRISNVAASIIEIG